MTVDGVRVHQAAPTPGSGSSTWSIRNWPGSPHPVTRSTRCGPAELGGFDVIATVRRTLGTTEAVLALDGAPGTDLRLAPRDIADADPARLVIRLENRLAGLETLKTKTQTEAERLRTEAAHAAADLGKPFPQTSPLSAARERVAQIDKQLKHAATPPQQANGNNPVVASAIRDAVAMAGLRNAAVRYVSADEIERSDLPETVKNLAEMSQGPATGHAPGPAPQDDQAPAPHLTSAADLAGRSFPEDNPLAGSPAPAEPTAPTTTGAPRRSPRPAR